MHWVSLMQKRNMFQNIKLLSVEDVHEALDSGEFRHFNWWCGWGDLQEAVQVPHPLEPKLKSEPRLVESILDKELSACRDTAS